ncbi:MAG TPA: response regulator transcription factor [Acidimicrobiales bacterium]|nr:response regulator transcription factor [Acidimicrobiales bacterium]
MANGAPPEDPIQVYLVDDHAVVRTGMRAYLEQLDDMEVVGEARDGGPAVDELGRMAKAGQAPDVVVMDILMPGMDGIAATALIRERHPEIEVVALTSFVAQDKIQAALAAGAAGYVLKDAEADEVAAAIRGAHHGEVHISPAAVRELAKALRPAGSRRTVEPLTERERDVLALVARGASNKEIGQALFISERTARTHVSNILAKVGLRSRTQAALWAIREGLAAPEA